ncbi:SxtJ family membrane protein [Thiovibrio sp. JS02]
MSAGQAKDTGLAVILICLLLIHFAGYDFLLLPAIGVLLVTMTCPGILAPLARVWFAFSHLLGSVMSRVFLAAIFYGVATPIGLLRRFAGADAMRLRSWKKGEASVFKERNHTFVKEDIEKPY